MININSDIYDTLAQELITEVVDRGRDEGVVEIRVDEKRELIFAFSNVDYTLARGIDSMSYIVLAFENGRRVSTDFNADVLDEKISR